MKKETKQFLKKLADLMERYNVEIDAVDHRKIGFEVGRKYNTNGGVIVEGDYIHLEKFTFAKDLRAQIKLDRPIYERKKL